MKCALATAQRLIAAANAQGRLWSAELLPGPLFDHGRDPRSLDLFVSLFTNPYFHACGTCAMSAGDEASGPEPTGGRVQRRGVVGPDLQVKGIKGLRVADASIIPAIPSGPTAALCMVIGDVAAELISGETSRDC